MDSDFWRNCPDLRVAHLDFFRTCAMMTAAPQSPPRPKMNTQERLQLTAFLQQLSEASAAPQDDEADALIRAACARQPQATYLLVQRAMLLEQAVAKAQNEITDLRDQLAQARHRSPAVDANAWGNLPAPPPALPLPPSSAPASGAVPAATAWGSGMLTSIATTAAGVVAGGFLFRGIEQLIGNHAAGTINEPSSPAASAAIGPAPGNESGGAEIFDTSSVDDYIAGNTDGDA
jgi:hypothetical protein